MIQKVHISLWQNIPCANFKKDINPAILYLDKKNYIPSMKKSSYKSIRNNLKEYSEKKKI